MRSKRPDSGLLRADPDHPGGDRLYAIRAYAHDRGWSHETVAYALSLPATLFPDVAGWTAGIDLIERWSRILLVDLRSLSC